MGLTIATTPEETFPSIEPALIFDRVQELSNLVVALNNAMEQWSYSNCDGSYFYCNEV